MTKICRNFIPLWVGFFLLVAGAPVFADAPLSWQDCVQETAEHNPDIQAAQDTLRSAKEQIGASRSDFFPKLTANAGYNTGNTSNFNNPNSSNPGVNVNVGNRQQLTVGASLSQNLFAGMKTLSVYQRTKAAYDEALASLDAAKSQVSLDLKTAFARLLFFQQQMSVVKQIAERRSENLRFIKLRYEGGQEDKGNLMRNQALLEQATYDVGQTERQLRVGQRQLAKVLGRSTAGNYEGLQVKGNFKTLFPEKPPDFDAMVDEHPDHRRAFAQLREAQADVKVARGDLMPSLDASASISQQKLNDNPSGTNWSAGVNLSYPLYLGGRDYYEWHASKFLAARADAALKTADDQIAVTLKQAYSDFKDAIENIKVQQGFLNSAEVRAEIARAQYANGLLSYQDWDLIENDLINNQNTILGSLRDALIAEGNWEKAQGKGAIP